MEATLYSEASLRILKNITLHLTVLQGKISVRLPIVTLYAVKVQYLQNMLFVP
jgi:hypothetical protein